MRAPSWLKDRRVAAATRAHDTGVPSVEQEEWRYSPIAQLDLDRFAVLLPSGDAPAGMPAGARRELERFASLAGAVVLCNGRLVHSQLDADVAAAGVVLGPLADVDDGDDLLGRVIDAPVDAFVDLNTAFSPDPVVLRVPAGVTVERPVVVISWIHTGGAASFPRLVVDVGEQASVTLVEVQGGARADSLCVPVTEVDVDRGGHLELVTVQDHGVSTWQLATVASRVGQEARLEMVQAGLGGSYARTRTDCHLVGRGATGDLFALYFGEGDQTLDYRTFQHHKAPDTTSNLLYKGALDGRSRSIYTGMIKVGEQARGTNAFQTNRNLKLSDEAWAESVPNLEIANNDVQCSHASTVGPIDADQRFYLESRGVPPVVAERLIVAGFFDEVLAAVPVPEVAAHLRNEIVARLGRRER